LLTIKPEANKVFNPLPTFNAFKIRNISKEAAREEIASTDGYAIVDTTPLFLFFGFVREYKGLKHLLNAMPGIVKELPDCKLLVLGSFGDDKQSYLDLIEENGVSDSILLKDTYTPDNEVEKYFTASDIVILPYEDATQSGIVQISYGFEKPVLVTNVGGLPDVVTDGKTGYVVEPRNPEAITEKVLDFYQNKRMDEFHESIKAEAYRFEWTQMVQSIKTLLENNN